jgi:hypothetical protein
MPLQNGGPPPALSSIAAATAKVVNAAAHRMWPPAATGLYRLVGSSNTQSMKGIDQPEHDGRSKRDVPDTC